MMKMKSWLSILKSPNLQINVIKFRRKGEPMCAVGLKIKLKPFRLGKRFHRSPGIACRAIHI
jgi:hypothetical protein